jgi:hypothetical protein
VEATLAVRLNLNLAKGTKDQDKVATYLSEAPNATLGTPRPLRARARLEVLQGYVHVAERWDKAPSGLAEQMSRLRESIGSDTTQELSAKLRATQALLKLPDTKGPKRVALQAQAQEILAELRARRRKELDDMLRREPGLQGKPEAPEGRPRRPGHP